MPKTLVVDDDPRTAEAVCDRAGVDGEVADHRFVYAATDTEALRIMADDADLDVAMVAIDSDRIGGMGLFRRLGSVRLRIPRIALTAGRDLSGIRRAINEGAADFLVKPILAEDLWATIDRVHRATQERRRVWRTEAELAALRREVDIAGEIQRRILPTRFPCDGDLEMFARTVPAAEMGGDFYDVFELAPGRLGLAIADVSGKGVPAAFFMAVARTLIRATAGDGAAPAQCLARVNDLLCGHNIPGMFVSVFYGVLDTAAWRLTYSNGGHPPPLLADRGGSVRPLLGGHGVVLGVRAGLPYAEATVALAPGDVLCCVTDGVTEASDNEREQFSEDRLADCLAANREQSPETLAATLFAAVEAFARDGPHRDDVTRLMLKRRPAAEGP